MNILQNIFFPTCTHGRRKQGGAGGRGPPKNCWAIIFIKGLFTSHPIFFATILALGPPNLKHLPTALLAHVQVFHLHLN